MFPDAPALCDGAAAANAAWAESSDAEWAAAWAAEEAAAPWNLRDMLPAEIWGEVFAFGELAERRRRIFQPPRGHPDRTEGGVSREYELIRRLTQSTCGGNVDTERDFSCLAAATMRLRRNGLTVRVATHFEDEDAIVLDVSRILRAGPGNSRRQVHCFRIERGSHSRQASLKLGTPVPPLALLALGTFWLDPAALEVLAAREVTVHALNITPVAVPKAADVLSVGLTAGGRPNAAAVAVPAGARYGELRIRLPFGGIPSSLSVAELAWKLGADLLRASEVVVITASSVSSPITARVGNQISASLIRGGASAVVFERITELYGLHALCSLAPVLLPPGTRTLRVVVVGTSACPPDFVPAPGERPVLEVCADRSLQITNLTTEGALRILASAGLIDDRWSEVRAVNVRP